MSASPPTTNDAVGNESGSSADHVHPQSEDATDVFTISAVISDGGSPRKRSREPRDEASGERIAKRAYKRTHVKGTSRSSKKDVNKWKFDLPYATLPRYLRLLSEEAQERAENADFDDGDGEDEVYGLTEWTEHEQNDFYRLLSCKGRHNQPAIADGIGTKGVPEVADLLRRLKDGFVQVNLETARPRLCHFINLPAAFEVGAEAEASLDKLADAAVETLFEEDLQDEQEHHGDFAIIDANNIHVFCEDDAAEDSIVKGEDPAEDDLKDEANSDLDTTGLRTPTLTTTSIVLDLHRMIELSQYVFMNSKVEGENWQTLGSGGQTPGIFQTALLKIYQDVISMTERLASTAHFLALSRIRATDNKARRNVLRRVRRRDVAAAVDVLNLEHNAHSFWTKCPRKCRLRVYRGRRDTQQAQRLTDDQAEQILAAEGRWPRLNAGQNSAATDPRFTDDEPDFDIAEDASLSSLSSQNSKHDSRAESQASDISMAENDDLDSGSLRSKEESDAANSDAISLDEQSDAEATDVRHSQDDEVALRIKLHGLKRSTASPEISPKRGPIQRKDLEDLKDWTDWIEYKPQWERYPRPLVKNEPVTMQSIESFDLSSLIDPADDSSSLGSQPGDDDEHRMSLGGQLDGADLDEPRGRRLHR